MNAAVAGDFAAAAAASATVVLWLLLLIPPATAAGDPACLSTAAARSGVPARFETTKHGDAGSQWLPHAK